jgi:hypothetical protein
VLACYKQEIIVARGEETPKQAKHTRKELIEQLNNTRMEGEVVVARHVLSRDIFLTIDDEQTCTKRIVDRK